MPLLDYANLNIEEGKLFNRQFGDIYFQPQSGFAESEHTFIHANHLTERFKRLENGQSFTIAEIGFGSGLNFINTVQHFFHSIETTNNARDTCAKPKLVYCSVEKHPIRLSELKSIQRHWPLAEIRKALYEQYPHNHPGFHLLTLHPQVCLLLLMGEATEMISALQATVDAWFLDGFAPSKNPDCWSQDLLQEIARCSHSHTTLSSFSAARLLRDNLQLNGFSYEKKTGFGHKREMISATLRKTPHQSKHWSDLPAAPRNKRVAIIGAGIAGATTAYALAKNGFNVVVLHAPDKYPAASTVPLAVPYLQPSLNESVIRDYQLNAWHHALRHLQQLNKLNPNILQSCRIIRQPVDERESQRQVKLFKQTLLNEQYWAINEQDIHYLQAGVIQPNELISTLLSHENITVKQQTINSLTPLGNQWRIAQQDFDIIIIATGWQTSLYPDEIIRQTLRPIRGQGTFLKVADKDKPRDIYCNHHAFIPDPNQDMVYAGSSFYPNSHDLSHHEEDDKDNKAAFLATFATNARHLSTSVDIVDSFVGIRSAAHDYQPLLGPIPIEKDVIAKYQAWAKDARLPIEQMLNFHHGLYVNAGYGSKGMTNAFLNADILTAMITASPLPIDKKLLPFILPARIIIKQIIRRQL